ncbi:MAG: hypothetical protein DMG49_18630 [Acidobacteria bacterium]|nr:MAG: hypothetical protein DMG49_18630 [Acidobacteriota bacterium]
MSTPTGRSGKRVAIEVLVEIARPDPTLPKETAISENISTGGMRISTDHVWLAGDLVLLSSTVTADATPARVVYCQRLENQKFSVGLELLEPRERSR